MKSNLYLTVFILSIFVLTSRPAMADWRQLDEGLQPKANTTEESLNGAKSKRAKSMGKDYSKFKRRKIEKIPPQG